MLSLLLRKKSLPSLYAIEPNDVYLDKKQDHNLPMQSVECTMFGGALPVKNTLNVLVPVHLNR